MTKILVNLTTPPKKSVKSRFISKKSVKNQAINCANQIKPLTKVISPFVNDTNTGIGSSGADAVSIIAGGVEGLNVTGTKISGSAKSTGSFGSVVASGAGISSLEKTDFIDSTVQIREKQILFSESGGSQAYLYSGGSFSVLRINFSSSFKFSALKVSPSANSEIST